jgi:hypothetical protein
MAETEFDELDKAVASVLTPAPADPPAPIPEEIPVVVQTTPPPEPTVSVAPRMRSTGRFMDVVPPSKIARPEPVVIPPAVETTPPPTFEQPDPLDFQGFKMDETPTPTEAASETPAVEPLGTPFLSDAKVEKRPLGAFSDTPKPPEDTPAPADPEVPVVLPGDQEKPTSLPAELHTDLLSIESSESSVEEMPPTPSIVQQYQEKPNSDTQPSAAIYDGEAYHMPLVHGAKKQSSWLVVIWIAALLVVGSGIGVILYFVVLPMLG